MPYLNCPNCRMSVAAQSANPRQCPRCWRRYREAVGMLGADSPYPASAGGLAGLADAVLDAKRAQRD